MSPPFVRHCSRVSSRQGTSLSPTFEIQLGSGGSASGKSATMSATHNSCSSQNCDNVDSASLVDVTAALEAAPPTSTSLLANRTRFGCDAGEACDANADVCDKMPRLRIGASSSTSTEPDACASATASVDQHCVLDARFCRVLHNAFNRWRIWQILRFASVDIRLVRIARSAVEWRRRAACAVARGGGVHWWWFNAVPHRNSSRAFLAAFRDLGHSWRTSDLAAESRKTNQLAVAHPARRGI